MCEQYLEEHASKGDTAKPEGLGCAFASITVCVSYIYSLVHWILTILYELWTITYTSSGCHVGESFISRWGGPNNAPVRTASLSVTKGGLHNCMADN